MTLTAPHIATATGAATGAATAPARRFRTAHVYAGLTALLGADLVLFGPWIAAHAIDAPILSSSMSFGLFAQALGVLCILFAGAFLVAIRRGGAWLAPTVAGAAGVVSVLAALAGVPVLTGFGLALLSGLAAIDFAFMALLRRDLAA